MAIVRPFKAIRPAREYAEKVAALPYDVMSSDEAREMVKGNPYSFLHIDKAEIDLDLGIDLYSDAVYNTAKKNLDTMVREHTLIQEEKTCLYIYQLKMDSYIQTGLVFCASIDDYINGTIKKHELTRADKEQDRIRHVDTCNANTGPIFLTYRDEAAIQTLMDQWIQEHRPVYDFQAEDGITHTVWVIDCDKTIRSLTNLFGSVPALYIADGHHRNASAVKVGLQRRKENPGYTGEEEFNFYLAVAFPASHLHVLDYNRVVKDLNGLSKEDFLHKIREHFDVSEPKQDAVCPSAPKTFGMYLDHQWYTLKAKEHVYASTDCVEQLDVSLLQNYLLSPVLGIADPRTDNRIAFIGGIRGVSELEMLVNEKRAEVAFSMYPTSIDEVMKIADEGKIMPPKSTWFEPKLRSGLFIHSFE